MTIEGLEKVEKVITALYRENRYLPITKAGKELSLNRCMSCFCPCEYTDQLLQVVCRSGSA